MAIICPLYNPAIGWYIIVQGLTGPQVKMINSPSNYYKSMGVNPPNFDFYGEDDLIENYELYDPSYFFYDEASPAVADDSHLTNTPEVISTLNSQLMTTSTAYVPVVIAIPENLQSLTPNSNFTKVSYNNYGNMNFSDNTCPAQASSSKSVSQSSTNEFESGLINSYLSTTPAYKSLSKNSTQSSSYNFESTFKNVNHLTCPDKKSSMKSRIPLSTNMFKSYSNYISSMQYVNPTYKKPESSTFSPNKKFVPEFSQTQSNNAQILSLEFMNTQYDTSQASDLK